MRIWTAQPRADVAKHNLTQAGTRAIRRRSLLAAP